MVYSVNRIATLPAYKSFLLGFNEPDNEKSPDYTTPHKAAQAWAKLQGKYSTIASPATAKNP